MTVAMCGVDGVRAKECEQKGSGRDVGAKRPCWVETPSKVMGTFRPGVLSERDPQGDPWRVYHLPVGCSRTCFGAGASRSEST